MMLTQSDDPLLLHYALSIIDFWALKRWNDVPKGLCVRNVVCDNAARCLPTHFLPIYDF
jgi:hypothetical protein